MSSALPGAPNANGAGQCEGRYANLSFPVPRDFDHSGHPTDAIALTGNTGTCTVRAPSVTARVSSQRGALRAFPRHQSQCQSDLAERP